LQKNEICVQFKEPRPNKQQPGVPSRPEIVTKWVNKTSCGFRRAGAKTRRSERAKEQAALHRKLHAMEKKRCDQVLQMGVAVAV
jgi:hypothetical protein